MAAAFRVGRRGDPARAGRAGAAHRAHIGSTAVPGLAAKPIIDILLVVADPADEASYVPDLERAGYVLRIREPAFFEHRMLKDAGDPEIDCYLVFRERLRRDAADRELYARTKRELAARDWRHVQHDADAKTDVIERILARACATPGSPAIGAFLG